MLGIRGNHAEEFVKANIVVKAIRLEEAFPRTMPFASRYADFAACGRIWMIRLSPFPGRLLEMVPLGLTENLTPSRRRMGPCAKACRSRPSGS